MNCVVIEIVRFDVGDGDHLMGVVPAAACRQRSADEPVYYIFGINGMLCC